VPAIVSLLVVPAIVHWLYRPQITHTPEATAMARRGLAEMGRPKWGEIVVMVVFLGVCGGWIACGVAEKYGATTIVALCGVAALLLSGVLTWDDAISERGAWDVFIWYGGLVQMGKLLNDAGATKVFADYVAGALGGMPLAAIFLVLALVYFYAHYAFASITAHILSMYPAFVAVLLALGAPPWLVTCCFAFLGNLCAGLTHYGTTPAPIIFSTDYVSQAAWWRMGLILSVVNLAIWLTVGLAWWKICGLW
jgi:DASS family divalent anion:Na+ symporter